MDPIFSKEQGIELFKQLKHYLETEEFRTFDLFNALERFNCFGNEVHTLDCSAAPESSKEKPLNVREVLHLNPSCPCMIRSSYTHPEAEKIYVTELLDVIIGLFAIEPWESIKVATNQPQAEKLRTQTLSAFNHMRFIRKDQVSPTVSKWLNRFRGFPQTPEELFVEYFKIIESLSPAFLAEAIQSYSSSSTLNAVEAEISRRGMGLNEEQPQLWKINKVHELETAEPVRFVTALETAPEVGREHRHYSFSYMVLYFSVKKFNPDALGIAAVPPLLAQAGMNAGVFHSDLSSLAKLDKAPSTQEMLTAWSLYKNGMGLTDAFITANLLE